ncbi:hypothetical protein HG15A2_37930 [Adhaeretor mobilis]|uniref:Uncharacterized protein n=1 Tax=Adhaeretor mobilis TaxID=1930276 RepID=A0A517N008_9BACT|nr:hypothetical protein HG15A2_37930 [Adhaeretor mobilis]
MRATDLDELLRCEGCNPSNYSISASAHDAWCLDLRDGEWVVFYSERGIDSPPIYASKSEREACDFFFDKVTGEKHWHIVGFFRHESDALVLESKLTAAGVDPIRNDIPVYRKANDPRFRVFVVGKDIFRYRQLFGEPKFVSA